MFFNFSSAFSIIQPGLLRAKLENMQVDSSLLTWVDDYLKDRSQYVRLHNCVCLTVWSATSVPSMELCCLPSSSPPTLQILSNAVSRVICRNSLMTRTLVGQTLTLWIHANTWVWCWTIIWSGLQMQRQSTRIYRYSISLLCHLFRCCVLGWGHQGEGCKQT